MVRPSMEGIAKENTRPSLEERTKSADLGFGETRSILVENGQDVCLSSDTDSEFSSSQEKAKRPKVFELVPSEDSGISIASTSDRPIAAPTTTQSSIGPYRYKRTLMRSQRRAQASQERSIQRHVATGQGIGKGGIKRLIELHEKAKQERQNEEIDRNKRAKALDYLACTMSMAPFRRLVVEIFRDVVENSSINRISGAVIGLLLKCSEDFLMRFFEQCSYAVVHGGRVTLMPKDVLLTFRMDDFYRALLGRRYL